MPKPAPIFHSIRITSFAFDFSHYNIRFYAKISSSLSPLTRSSNPNPKSLLEMKAGKSKADSKKTDGRLAVKKPTKKEKLAAKDPNKPKRPPSAFFVFMESFRKEFKEKNPNNKAVSAVGKAAGAEWKSLTEEEKAPYIADAEKRKEEFERQMEAYNKKLAGGDDDEESDKSKSEVNDEDDEEGSGEEEEDDD